MGTYHYWKDMHNRFMMKDVHKQNNCTVTLIIIKNAFFHLDFRKLFWEIFKNCQIMKNDQDLQFIIYLDEIWPKTHMTWPVWKTKFVAKHIKRFSINLRLSKSTESSLIWQYQFFMTTSEEKWKRILHFTFSMFCKKDYWNILRDFQLKVN